MILAKFIPEDITDNLIRDARKNMIFSFFLPDLPDLKKREGEKENEVSDPSFKITFLIIQLILTAIMIFNLEKYYRNKWDTKQKSNS